MSNMSASNHGPEMLYPEDLAGELCDKWVGSGGVFVFEATAEDPEGTYRSHAELYVEPPLVPHNPDLVSTVTDSWGRAITCVTVEGSGHTRLPRLMTDLPAEYLVHASLPTGGSQARTSPTVPVGIRLNALPEVRRIVEAAYTELPAGPADSRCYPKGALVLSGTDRRSLLSLFDAVLSPPSVKPVTTTGPAETVERRSTPVASQPQRTPPAQPEASTSIPPAQPELSPARRQDRKDSAWQIGALATSYAFTLAVGYFGPAAIDSFREGSPDAKLRLLQVVLSGAGAVSSFWMSKQEDW